MLRKGLFAITILLVVIYTYHRDALSYTSLLRPLTGSSATANALFQQLFSNKRIAIPELPALKQLCAKPDYREDLFLDCQIGAGGMTTLLSHFKSCFYLGLGLGMNVILPRSPKRSAALTFNLESHEHLPLSHWLDEEYLINTIAKTCPQTKLIKMTEEQISVVPTHQIMTIETDDAPFGSAMGPYAADDAERAWRPFYQAKLDAIAKSDMTIVRTTTRAMQFNITAGQTSIFNELQYLMRMTPSVRRLIDAVKPSDPYFGIHFRAEADVAHDALWTSSTTQLARVFDTAERARRKYAFSWPKVIYLACGDKNMTALFRETAAKTGWTVLDKWSILERHQDGTALMQELDALDFDQEAFIDYAMLLISRFFIGTGISAFSYSVAHLRDSSGRFTGNDLDDVPGAAVAYTHLFEAEDASFLYQCCL